MKYALSLLITLAAIGAAQAAGTDWVLVTTPAPGAPKVFYSPTTVKLENDRGTPVRATKVKIVTANGSEKWGQSGVFARRVKSWTDGSPG